MITFQPDVDAREVKVDWYFKERPGKDDGTLREVYPHFVITEKLDTWSGEEW